MDRTPAPTEKKPSSIKKTPRPKKMHRFLKGIIYLIGLFIAITLFRIIYGIIGIHIIYSEGERAGMIVKLSQKGLIWKTWEGEATVYQGGVATTYIWVFSIDNNDPNKQELLNKVQSAFQSGQPVKLIYQQTIATPPWRGTSTYFVKDLTDAQ